MPATPVERCPVCGGRALVARWPVPAAAEDGVDPEAFRPSADRFGQAVATVVRCLGCGHGIVAVLPPEDAVGDAYRQAADAVSIREEPGQLETARRALIDVERFVAPGRLLDVGCWTGSLLAAASARGWDAVGLEPSAWAVDRARQRGVRVVQGRLGDRSPETAGPFRAVVCCDVLEHLADPRQALLALHGRLEPGGVLLVTVPDAGSVTARVFGRRWWSVLPMHLQYFTGASLARLLHDAGFEVVDSHRHPKVFSLRYYAERVAAFLPGAGAGAALVARSPWSDRLAGPDLRDRLAVIARIAARPSQAERPATTPSCRVRRKASDSPRA